MNEKVRGADLVARTLDRAGFRTIFTLSGNHIMPLFDAALGTGLKLIHVRHEAACVHMADAYARRTGQCGIALVTGGAGHTNAVAALCTAQSAEAPLVLLSGHAPLNELGRGSFQELRQADMAEPVTKASWTAGSAETLAHDIAEAVRIATSGRPGPVHVSLPVDLLDESVADADDLWPDAQAFAAPAQDLSEAAADAVLAALAEASRPLILCGPLLCHTPHAPLVARLGEATGVPALPMESPRGINDPALGAFADVLKRADLVVLLGKPHDFTIRFGQPPHIDAACRFVVIDPEAAMIARAAREQGPGLILSALADAPAAAARLIARAGASGKAAGAWAAEVKRAVAYRPEAWAAIASGPADPVHPAELCRAIQPFLDRNPAATLVCDGGEIGQWAQSLLSSPQRVINGVAGSIGSAVPFAMAARAADPSAPAIAVMGDGAFGFHLTEFDTALRHGLPMVVVVGNDATWNAEHQIQLRSYGAERAHSCELLPTRYDEVVRALGGHGEFVERAAGLAPALERALASGKPACVNVMIQRMAAPVVRLPA
jgi:acetolactate synthase-1/2/3 large subunit